MTFKMLHFYSEERQLRYRQTYQFIRSNTVQPFFLDKKDKFSPAIHDIPSNLLLKCRFS
jgi:hypothetical protein